MILHGMVICCIVLDFFFFQAEDGIRDVAVTGVQTCALPISWLRIVGTGACKPSVWTAHIFAPLKTIHGSVCRVTFIPKRSEEHTSELQSRLHLVCRLLLVKKTKGQWYRYAPSNVSPSYQLLEAFPSIHELP